MKNLPAELRGAHPQIPWARIAGMRDKVVHDYMGIDYELVWTVATELVAPLKAEVQVILSGLEESGGAAS